MIGNATLYLGDCSELLPSLDRSYALISDPPYGIRTNTDRTGRRGKMASRGALPMVLTTAYEPVRGDDRPFDPAPLLGFKQVVLWGANHYCDRLPGAPHWLAWDKREGTTSDDNADCELAWTNLKGPARLHRQLWRGLCRRGEENIASAKKRLAWRVHPTQKPVALMSWCIAQAGTPPVVIDPYMGSGSTGVAAVRAGLRFIGIELSEQYFNVACERIRLEQSQPDLLLGLRPTVSGDSC